MLSRRNALLTLAAGAFAPALPAQHQHSEPPPIAPLVPKTLAAADFQSLGPLVDLILPRTDTPGASDAGVPIFIDRAAGRRPELAQELQEGLAKLRESRFFAAGQPEQIARLTAMQKAGDAFFTLIKDLTMDGYYTSRDGLVKELGYHGNTYLKEFTGCTHPEHQVGG